MSVAELLEAARNRAEAITERCRKAPMPIGPLARGGSSWSFSGEMSPEQAHNQALHYRNWVFTAIRPIAQRIAGQPILMARTRTKTQIATRNRQKAIHKSPPQWMKQAPRRLRQQWTKEASDLELVEDHQLLNLFEDPNEVNTAWALQYITVANLELTGRAFWWFTDWENRRQLYPLPAAWVRPVHDESDGRFGVNWKVRTPGSGEEVEVPGDDMLYFAYPDPSDPAGGFGPLQAIGHAITTDKYIQVAQLQAFENGIHPSLALVIGKEAEAGIDAAAGRPLLEAQQHAQIVNMIKRRYAGVMRAGEPLILDALIQDVKKLSLTPEEMGFQVSGQITKERIMQGYGVSPTITGQVEANSRAASAEADRHFCNNTVNPKAELMSQVLTGWLGPRYAGKNEKLYIWIEPCEPKDSEDRRQWMQLGLANGAVSVEEFRAEIGYDPELDPEHTVNMPFSLVPVQVSERFNTQEPAESETGGTGNGPANGTANGNGEQESDTNPAEGKSYLDKQGRFTRKGYCAFWLKVHSRKETKLVGDLQRFFGQQSKSILAKLKKLAGGYAETFHEDADANAIVAKIFDPDSWTVRLKKAIKPHLAKAALTGASLEYEVAQRNKHLARHWRKEQVTLDIPADVMQAIRGELADSFDQEYWDGISQTRRDKLRRLIAKSIKAGTNLNDVIDSVEKLLGRSGSYEQAFAIARTEITGAINAGHWAARQDLINDGLITGSEWLDSGDGQVRATHNIGGTVVKAGEMFNVGGYEAPYPGHYSLPAKERVRCRCLTVAAGSFADDE